MSKSLKPRPRNNTSGVVGFSVRRRKNCTLLMVSGVCYDGRKVSSEFSIDAHSLLGAARLAVAWRQQWRPQVVQRFAEQDPIPSPTAIARRLRRAYPQLLRGL